MQTGKSNCRWWGNVVVVRHDIQGNQLKVATTNAKNPPADFSGKVGKLAIYNKAK